MDKKERLTFFDEQYKEYLLKEGKEREAVERLASYEDIGTISKLTSLKERLLDAESRLALLAEEEIGNEITIKENIELKHRAEVAEEALRLALEDICYIQSDENKCASTCIECDYTKGCYQRKAEQNLKVSSGAKSMVDMLNQECKELEESLKDGGSEK